MNMCIRLADNTTVCYSIIAALLLSLGNGCGQPIYDSISLADTSTWTEQSTDTQQAQAPEWPLNSSGYVVAKPPRMSFVTTFESALDCPDPVGQPLVPWDASLLDPRMDETLRFAFDDSSLAPELRFELAPDQYDGPLAYDIRDDGQRLAVIDDGELVLYDTEDGKILKRKSLDQIFRNGDSAMVVRFAGPSLDLIVASEKSISRIEGESLEFDASRSSVGDPIADFTVSDQDEHLMIRTESGSVFAGDSQLNTLNKLKLGKGQSFKIASLSDDGMHLGVIDGGVATMFKLDQYKVFESKRFESNPIAGATAIRLGRNNHIAFNRDSMFYVSDADGEWSTPYFDTMLWRTKDAQTPARTADTNNLVFLGQRVVNQKIETILFDYWPNDQRTGGGEPLDHDAESLIIDASGFFAVTRSQGRLRLLRRQLRRSNRWASLNQLVYDWVDEKKFDQLAEMTRACGQQKRLGNGFTAESIRTKILEAAAARWHYLEKNKEKPDVTEALEKWRQEGSPEALTISAVRHDKLAWIARGNGRAHEVSEAGNAEYRRRMKLAYQELTEALQSPRPPLIALENHITTALQVNGDVDAINPTARRCVELYPGEAQPFAMLAHFLGPQWFGEHGVAFSLGKSVANLHCRPTANLMYLRFSAAMVSGIDLRNTNEWKSYDPVRAHRGLQEFIRQDMSDFDVLWNYFVVAMFHKRNSDAEQAIEHTMAKTPWIRINLYNRSTDIRPIARQMINDQWAAAERSTTPR